MAYQRIDRISEEMRRDLDRIIREELSDPRISGTFSITRVDVTRDLKFAKVYISVLEQEKEKDLMAALASAAGYIRRSLGKEMIIRTAPELLFTPDHNIAYGVHIAEVLKQVNTSEENGSDEQQ